MRSENSAAVAPAIRTALRARRRTLSHADFSGALVHANGFCILLRLIPLRAQAETTHRGKLASLLYADELVCGDVVQLIDGAAWPANFYQVDHCLITQPKVQPQVVLG